MARDIGGSFVLQDTGNLHGNSHIDNQCIVQQAADFAPLGVCTAETSSQLDSGLMGINNSSLVPLYSYSSSMIVSRSASMQEIERDMMARMHPKQNEAPAYASGISSSLAQFQSQDPSAQDLNKSRDRSFANILTPQPRTRVVQPVRKGEFLSINIDDSLHQQGVRKLENSLIG